ncbi:hypothetical protein SAMN04488505_102750 [Chitinophaga rupis]|uniref:Dolichyl-phosphate-mannose-protein mannosyltransferase n=1 Tax=Chitinophaga rupis TaxID=573321 RepID=A0A1H7RWM5_9BACT|nr:hypothetical protein SAMN04488505_102750 [Chitinophaga rupis]
MKSHTICSIFISTLLAIVASYTVYFGYTTNYTTHAFSPASFKNQYDHGVYKYRILSKKILLFTDKALGDSYPDDKAERRLLIMDTIASERFYYAYYYVNSFFLILVSIVLVLLLDLEGSLKMNNGEKHLVLFLVPLLICLTQYVVCPYDISSYFFQLLIIFIYFKISNKYYWLTLFLVCFLLILATLNRESSALTVSFLVVLTLCKFGFTQKTIIFNILIIISFLATYVALRYYITDINEPKIYPDFLLYNLLVFPQNLGIIFWVVFFYLSMVMANSSDNKMMIVIYHLVSLPYIWTCFTAGYLWETRLYMPLFLGSLCFSKLDLSGFRFHPWEYLRGTKIYKELN